MSSQASSLQSAEFQNDMIPRVRSRYMAVYVLNAEFRICHRGLGFDVVDHYRSMRTIIKAFCFAVTLP